LTVETSGSDGTPNSCRYDSVKFAYTANGNQMFTDNVCGCLHDLSHFSCDKSEYTDIQYLSFAKDPEDHSETLVGTDTKFILSTDYSNFGGKVTVEWQCASQTASSTVSNTVEMAEALMTGAFKPSMATDYGCAGRGTFDAFSQTVGRAIDDTDHAFFAWKKCVQCAADHDQSAIGPYDYDVDNDSCGSTNRAFCECDRVLINKLVNATPLSAPTSISACVTTGGVDLECCNWDTHRWAAFNAENSCCGVDGVRENGMC